MICFNCGLKLYSKDVEECQLCGAKFAIRCLTCEHPNPPMAKFCFNCGSKIARGGMQSSVQNFDTLMENRKNVAVIFADVSGFTALSEKLDPEEVREIINECFNFITKPVYELEGTIDKYIGDCVMILFGAKYMHSDDARRAVFCAMRMAELIKSFSEERLSSTGFSLSLSVGINYGLVVTGSIGNYFDRDYTVMGDIVNTAQRLQSSAEKGKILVSESVFMETKDFVRYSRPKELVLKNKENVVRCYSPLRLDTGFSLRHESAFVGRKREIGVLNSLYNNAINTGTKCIVVKGEAGIGKTRLLKEFSTKVGSEIKKIWVDCSSVSQGRVYFLISHILMNAMNINTDDNPNAKKHRLMSFLEYILNGLGDEKIKRNYDFLTLVLGLDRDNEFQNILNSMSFDSIKRELLKQLVLFFENLCRKHRVLVIIDDAQWSDNYSLDIIGEIITLLPSVNAIFIFAARYETERLKAVDRGRYGLLKLEALDGSGINNMFCSIINCSTIDDELLQTINRVTKGNPLYIKEYASHIRKLDRFKVTQGTAVVDSKELTSLPGSIQNLLLSNLSNLDDSTKSFLQAASVVGKEFSLSMVMSLVGEDIDADKVLKLPVELNIILLKNAYTSAGIVEKVFTFSHDTEREVIYDSILNRTKREMHKKIGEYIEYRNAKDIENYYDVLSVHFHRAGLNKKAAGYYYKAALKHKNDFNFESSLEYFKKFLELLLDTPDGGNNDKYAEAHRDIGHINFIMGNYELALDHLNRALNAVLMSDEIFSIKIMIAGVYKEQGMFSEALALLDEIEPKIKQDDAMFGKLLQMKCNILRIIGNPDALSFARKSEKILLKTKDYHNLSETMNQAGIIYFMKGDVDNSLYYLNKSYSYAEKVNNLAVMVRASGNLGAIYHATGRVSKALELFGKSIEISRKISNLQGYISGSINLGILYLDKGLLNNAKELFHESLKLSKEISSRLYECISFTNLGDIMYEKGMEDRALEYYSKSLEIAREISLTVEEGVNYVSMSRIYINSGLFEKALELLELSFKIFTESGEITYLSDYYRYKCLYEKARGDESTAMNFCDRAIASSDECRSDTKRMKALRLKCNLLFQAGDYEKAYDVINESIKLSEQLESCYEAAKGYFAKGKVLLALSEPDEAKASLRKAKEAIGEVDHCRWTDIIKQYPL